MGLAVAQALPAWRHPDGERHRARQARLIKAAEQPRRQKYVFSSTLDRAAWDNSTIVRGDVAAEVTKLKQQEGRDLLIWGHGLLAETLLKQNLLDVLDISIYPIVAGRGKLFLREGQNANLRLITTKSFSKGIVKLTYEPQR